MENETLYGGDAYDILDCTRNLFWNLHSVTKYPKLPPQALRFPSRAVEAERETRVTGDDRLQEHSQVTTPKV